ncbi:MAG: ABC transporter permease [Sphaerochaetaceae bacterium]|nr:ABC transporter permease [Sphaerochaetaceae bacterium]NLV82968.1 ABC transporter permease [Spirochaetales bacterium]
MEVSFGKKILGRHETNLALILIVLSVVVSLINPAYFSTANLFKILKSSVEMGIFAIAFLVILILGGIDMSFPAIASASMYITIKLLISGNSEVPLIVPFLIAMAIGAALGALNGVFIGIMGLPTLIVTLGTMSIIKGALLVFVGKNWITQLPNVLIEFSRSNLLASVGDTGESIGLHSSVIILLVVALIVWALLRYTWFGRSIYAIGTNQIAAERDGIACKKTKFIACILSGVLAALAGLIHCSLVRVANPFDIFGTELNVIAAVVLGGASLTGGAGTVGGTLLGVFLINIINNSLILMGIHSYWQKFVVGLIVILSTVFTANRDALRQMLRRNVTSSMETT